uniref:Tumor necrosis factor (ligand) superfamily, member 10 n=1 Tax=Peromyscus maniculatus bairdii TaxID=230844 RepID=A0A8C8TNT1_PERMB
MSSKANTQKLTTVISRGWDSHFQFSKFYEISVVNVIKISKLMCSLQLYSVSTQLQNKYSRSGISCLLKEEEDSWGSTEEENRYCLQAKRELYQLIEEVTLRTFGETISTVPEKQRSINFPPRGGKPQRVAAHITGMTRKSSSALIPISKDGKILGQKIESWESSKKGHSFLSYVHLRNGELVIQEEGLYYIYSQTYFRFKEVEDTPKAASVTTSTSRPLPIPKK